MDIRKALVVLVTFLALLLPSCTTAQRTTDASRSLRLPLDNGVFGPETLVFDHRGGGPYTGVSDGRVLRWGGSRVGWTEFAYNSRHRLPQCVANKNPVASESTCGRPLGLRFHKKSGSLYIADAYLGLMRVGPRGGLATVLAADADGVPFNFLNGIDVDQVTGDVYLTDSSTTYQRKENQKVVPSRDVTGRLMKYDPRTNRVTVLRTGLPYPNGVAMSSDRTHLVVAQTSTCQLLKYWLKGPKAGELEVFAELPGYPDNVRRDGRGGYWVAINCDKVKENSTVVEHRTAGVRVSGQGEVVEVLTGRGNETVSEVVERKGMLWLGSVETPYVGLLRG